MSPSPFNLQDTKIALQRQDSDSTKKVSMPLPSGIIKPTPSGIIKPMPSYNPSPSFQPVPTKPRVGNELAIPPTGNENSNSNTILSPAMDPKPQTFSPPPLPFLAANLQILSTNGPMLSFLNSIERKK